MVKALFPEFCISCQREGAPLCRLCELSWMPDPSLERFATTSGSVRGVFSLSPYPDPVVKGLLRQWKYWGQKSSGEMLCRLVVDTLEAYKGALPTVEVVTYVPLHTRRLNYRGFDQAEMLAQTVAEVIHRPMSTLLKRTRFTEPQAKQARSARTEDEFKRAFEVSLLDATPPASVLLIDDVWTTGSTMRAASRVLRSAGVQEVWGFTCARG